MNKKKIKIGIDEAGRGPWCGSVVACALAFNPENLPSKDIVSKLNDSKKLSQKKRNELYERLIKLSHTPHNTSILNSFPSQGKEATNVASSLLSGDKGRKECLHDYPEVEPKENGERCCMREKQPQLFFGVGVVDNYFIDEYGIKAANREAMRRALVEIQRKIPKKYSEISVVIDGRDNYEFDELSQKPLYIVGGDGKVSEISAASIIAKVFRDKLMTQYATLYPNLGLESNAGYGTKKHKEALHASKDITGIHRVSYKPVKEVLEKKEKVLVHICCGPDATVPLMDLKKDYEVIAFWYDPNIQPKAEYDKRLNAFIQVCKIEGVEYIEGEYDVKNFFSKIKGLEHTPERGEKCTVCYDMRLEKTARLAREMGIKKWTSSLNNSPHKDMEKMFALGEKWSQTPPPPSLGASPSIEGEQKNASLGGGRCPEGGGSKKNELIQKLEFLKIAFRKNGGFQRSVDYTKKHGIYRQNYCGCVYSDTFPGKPSPQSSPKGRGGSSKGVKKGFSG